MFARRLYAHRGASAERPENTMPAFERAVEAGADALEMDVHLTRDGHLVVAHDDTALRTTGVPKPWTEMDLDEVGRLDAGWGFIAKDGSRPFGPAGMAVPCEVVVGGAVWGGTWDGGAGGGSAIRSGASASESGWARWGVGLNASQRMNRTMSTTAAVIIPVSRRSTMRGNMRRSEAAPLALHFARPYDCGPHVLGS